MRTSPRALRGRNKHLHLRVYRVNFEVNGVKPDKLTCSKRMVNGIPHLPVAPHLRNTEARHAARQSRFLQKAKGFEQDVFR